ncbi:MAG: ROK family transcriptional regulator [Clostridia bacterium]|nr:ROK family transcriptional regulator [Clostridia bacterium]
MKKFIDQQNMKQSNAADVFNLIRESGKMTRRDIEKQLGMSWGAVSGICARLIDEEYVSEVKKDLPTAKGRTPSYLEVNSAEHFAIGIDVNRAGLSAVLVNLKNHIIGRWTADSDFSSSSILTESVISLIERITESLGSHRIHCIGIAMQGVVDSESGISYSLPGICGWKTLDVVTPIRKRFEIPTYIEHDPNCILYASKSDFTKDTMLLRIDNGIGMAATLNGKIIAKSGIFEIGHTTAVRGGRPCMCGRRGCLEQYVSMRGIEKASYLEFSRLAELAREGDEKCIGYFDEMAEHLGLCISNTARLISLNDVILCGSICEYSDLFLEKLTSYVSENNSDVKISFTDVENASFGAALIAIERSLEQIDV